jgi:oxaloacetate decarboxylase (Na+ extruding) subunit gamma
MNNIVELAPNNLMAEALQITALGMGVVFSFLTLLIIATYLSSKIIMWTTAEVVTTNSLSVQKNKATSRSIDNNLVAVITAAVHKYRAQYR